ncbi:hypothetical protein JR316_0012443 [Psilocybe cubensis]|uniref:Uncharacterized protein n=2 Tax=Psilocybe cubensis TaxID=181762 RepID=A0ACB8GIV3_PSICU|nr:hypothetical protein JR316_0012443 [Psilocybe cubensis]KAH9475332.1 hypothetical protein JR316_0012443 [Psilocybe cubensis]
MDRQLPEKDTSSLEQLSVQSDLAYNDAIRDAFDAPAAPTAPVVLTRSEKLQMAVKQTYERKHDLTRNAKQVEEGWVKANEVREKADADAESLRDKAEAAKAEIWATIRRMEAVLKRIEADRAADRAKAEEDRVKAEADRAKAEEDRAKAEAVRAKAEADRAAERAKIKSLEAKFATLDSEVKMLKSKVEVLEFEKANVEARLRAHTQDIDLVFGMAKEVAQYVASQDSLWMNRIRRRAIVINSQEVLARILLPGSPPDNKNPPPDSKTWRNMLELEGKLSFTKTLINTLMTDDLAMQWISEDFGEFRDLGNDAAHPKYSKKVWQEVIDHMSIENQIDEEEKRSLGVLVNVTSYFKNEYL